MRTDGRTYRYDEVKSRFSAILRTHLKSTRRPTAICQRVRKNFHYPNNFRPALLVSLSPSILFSWGTNTNVAHRRHVSYLLTSTQYFCTTCMYVSLCIYVQHIPNTKDTSPTNQKKIRKISHDGHLVILRSGN
jgi:hypothetical protein